ASCVTRDEPTLSILYAGLVGNATPDPQPARQQRGRLPPRGRSTPVPEGRVTTKGKLTTLSGPIEPPDRFAVTGGRTAVERRANGGHAVTAPDRWPTAMPTCSRTPV